MGKMLKTCKLTIIDLVLHDQYKFARLSCWHKPRPKETCQSVEGIYLKAL